VIRSSASLDIYPCLGHVVWMRAGYILYYGLQEPPEKRSRFKLYLSCAMVITSVIPPELPMQLTMAVNNSLLALRKKAIYCTEPFRIPYGGKTEVCCFDKTGTLTSDHLVLKGLTPAPGGGGGAAEEGVMDDVAQWSEVRFPRLSAPLTQTMLVPAAAGFQRCLSFATRHKTEACAVRRRSLASAAAFALAELCTVGWQSASEARSGVQDAVMVLAACHSLVNINGDLVGDPLEKAAFIATNWLLTGAEGAPKVTGAFGRSKVTIEPLHKHRFSSELKRMSVLVRVSRGGIDTVWVFAKGAPEVMQRLMPNCPAGYEAGHRRFAAQGFRMIALAARLLAKGVTAAQARAMPRDEVRAASSALCAPACPHSATSAPGCSFPHARPPVRQAAPVTITTRKSQP
jgi:manganese-transporting P-type ATPase